MAANRLLIIEDDIEMATTLRQGFELDRYSVSVALDGGDGLEMARQGPFDAIVLDVMLPTHDGFFVTASLRAAGNATPIVMLTARDSVSDIVHGFDLGIADYVTKPFSFLELSARVRSLIRRNSPPSSLLVADDLMLDTISMSVSRNSQPISLTKSEYLLLEVLMRNSGHIVRRRELIDAVWGPAVAVEQNNLDVTISSLRAAVDKGFGRKLIQTIRGFGYKIDAGSAS